MQNKFKIGDKVKIAEGNSYITQSGGTIGSIIRDTDMDGWYDVKWENGHENTYRDNDLVPAIKFQIGDRVRVTKSMSASDREFNRAGKEETIKRYNLSNGPYIYVMESEVCYAEEQLELVSDGVYTHTFNYPWHEEDKKEDKPSNVKVGNIYEIKEDHVDACDDDCEAEDIKYIRITSIETDGTLHYDILDKDKEEIGSCYDCYDEDDLIISAQEHMNIKTLTEQQKAVLDANTQALLEAGIIGDDLELKDTNYVLTFLFDQNRDAIAKDAAQKLADAKAQAEATK